MTTIVRSLPILTFHTLEDRQSVISFSPQVFQRFMAGLNVSGYKTLTLQNAVDCMRKGMSFPDRSFVITFDDGYQTVYDDAFPVLQRYGMTATVFLTVGGKGAAKSGNKLPPSEGRSMLAWHEIREMQRCGMDFGAHTLTHPNLTRLSLELVETEICSSKMIIEDALSARVFSFAYPFGLYDDRSLEIVGENFACACSDKMGLITLNSNLHILKRVDAYYLRTDRLFNIMLTRLFPWYVRICNMKRGIRRAFQRN